MIKNVHIAMGDSATGCIRAALKMNKSSKYFGRIINFYDDLSVGILENMECGLEKRIAWINNMFAVTKSSKLLPPSEIQNDFENLYIKELNISIDSRIIIWCGNNVIEQTLLRYLVARFKKYEMYSINISEIIVKDYPLRSVAECSPDDLIKVLDKVTFINENKKIELITEWNDLQNSKDELRIFADKKVIGVDIAYYDYLLLNCLTDEFQHAPKIVGIVMGTSEQIVGDIFLYYRLRVLIEKDLAVYSGELNLLRDVKVKRGRNNLQITPLSL